MHPAKGVFQGGLLPSTETEFTPAERQLLDPLVEEFTIQMERK